VIYDYCYRSYKILKPLVVNILGFKNKS